MKVKISKHVFTAKISIGVGKKKQTNAHIAALIIDKFLWNRNFWLIIHTHTPISKKKILHQIFNHFPFPLYFPSKKKKSKTHKFFSRKNRKNQQSKCRCNFLPWYYFFFLKLLFNNTLLLIRGWRFLSLPFNIWQ